MIVLLYFDWFGPAKELSDMEKALAAAAATGSAVKYKGTYAPDNRKFHFVAMFETESYDKLMEIMMNQKKLPRDYQKLTHGMFEILRGPLKW